MLFGKNAIINTRHLLSKMDKKKINKLFENSALDLKKDYEVVILKNKLEVIKHDNIPIFFKYNVNLFPTIQNFDKNIYKFCVLDEGALEPIKRGAKIMIPGILKYKELCSKFDKGEVIGIDVLNNGIVAVGITLMSYEEIIKIKEGIAVEVYHVINDRLYNNNI